MYRCKGRTTEGRRCKRRLGEKDGYCPVHSDLPGMPIEVEKPISIDIIESFKDGDSSQRVCGHCCLLTLDRCCECSDVRDPIAVPADMRARNYCAKCKTQYDMRLPPPPLPIPHAGRGLQIPGFENLRVQVPHLANLLVWDFHRLR